MECRKKRARVGTKLQEARNQIAKLKRKIKQYQQFNQFLDEVPRSDNVLEQCCVHEFNDSCKWIRIAKEERR